MSTPVIPDPALVILIGPAGAGKSTWAARHFRPEEIVSSDRLRAIVGTGEHDLDASVDAFRVLESIVAARVRRKLLTVVDTLGLDPDLRRKLLAWARASDIPAIAVRFDTPLDECKARNRDRDRSVPAGVLRSQFDRYRRVRTRLADEGWEVVDADLTTVVEPISQRKGPRTRPTPG